MNSKNDIIRSHIIAVVTVIASRCYLTCHFCFFFFPFLLLRWNSLVELFFLFLYRNHAEGIIHPCQGCLRQTELSHLRGVLGLHRALEHRLGDQMFQVLFHPLHHHLLLSFLFLIISLAWGHADGSRLHFFPLLELNQMYDNSDPQPFFAPQISLMIDCFRDWLFRCGIPA